jgi:hypothetical protein
VAVVAAVILAVAVAVIMHTFIQGICNYIPATDHICRLYSVATVLQLQFMVYVTLLPMLNVLYFYSGSFRSIVRCPMWVLSCSFFNSCFPAMLLSYFLYVALSLKYF